MRDERATRVHRVTRKGARTESPPGLAAGPPLLFWGAVRAGPGPQPGRACSRTVPISPASSTQAHRPDPGAFMLGLGRPLSPAVFTAGGSLAGAGNRLAGLCPLPPAALS